MPCPYWTKQSHKLHFVKGRNDNKAWLKAWACNDGDNEEVVSCNDHLDGYSELTS